MPVYKDLTAPERATWDAIGTNTLVQLTLGTPTADPPATSRPGGEDREVRAQLLYELLMSANGPRGVPPRALKLAGAHITGTLDSEPASPCALRGAAPRHRHNTVNRVRRSLHRLQSLMRKP